MNRAEELLKKQRTFFAGGSTLSVDFRLQMLRRLKGAIERKEKVIREALRQDLGKSDFESYLCEIGMVLSEISYMQKHTKKLSARRRVPTPLGQFAARSYQVPSPYGNVLIMSPWNYPVLLTLGPLVDAIAAGNTIIVKPSAYAPATAACLKALLGECFPEEYIAVILGGRTENETLLRQKFDMIFFTGSQSVGKEVLRQAAENLTPTVLELGGKSPCIVDETAKLTLAAKRIVFGKYLNCGQTCVAPDFILCHRSVQEELITELKKQIRLQYGAHPLDNPDYGKIINAKHFERLCSLIDSRKVAAGGEVRRETLQIEPTILKQVTWEDAVMQEEIFGPVLPVLTYDSYEEVEALLQDKPKPLALYLFSEDPVRKREVSKRFAYGGGCINDTVIHLATAEMGFGGIGESGMGSYHGREGFEAFSHRKSIVEKATWMDLPMRYQPYDRKICEKIVRIFLR